MVDYKSNRSCGLRSVDLDNQRFLFVIARSFAAQGCFALYSKARIKANDIMLVWQKQHFPKM